MIHPLSDVQSKNIGENTTIWQYCVVLSKAQIGSNCNICSRFIEDDVFIGPNVSFCNDKYPKSKNKNFKCEAVVIKKGASIGANVTILPGVTIGENAIVAAGSVVVKDILANTKYIDKKNSHTLNPANSIWGGGLQFSVYLPDIPRFALLLRLSFHTLTFRFSNKQNFSKFHSSSLFKCG